MKTVSTILMSLLFVFLCSNSEAQQDGKNPYDVNFKIDYNQEAHYPQGEEAFYRYVYQNIQYSEEAKNNNINTVVLISFDVMPDSTLAGFVVLSSPGYGVDEELIRVLKPLKFAPAVANGQIIKQNVMLNIPVRAGVGSK
jgi:outer membrane biosynthesis protein TonB